jgi:bifunctional DNase/RNase
VRTGAPIYAEEAVLDKAGITLEEETGKPAAEGKSKGKVDEREMEGLSAYEDFIKSLNLEDFDRRKS